MRRALGYVVCLLCGCDRAATDPAPPAPTEAISNGDEAAETARVSIPQGQWLSGTRPGRFTRRPDLEPSLSRVQLGPFEIDRLPYASAPNAAPLFGASREEAGRLCGEAGGRLCTELEWERACSGPAGNPFASGNDYPKSCDGDACRSEFGVMLLGALPEWTASDFGKDSKFAGDPVLRGARSLTETPTFERRCAHRMHSRDVPAKELAFRCCYGPPNAARVQEPADGPVFEKARLDGKALQALLEQDPKTRPLAKDLILFSEPDAINTVIARGPGDRQGFDFTTAPLLWRPVVGSRFLVVAAKSGKDTSFVLVYHDVGDGAYDLASSFVLHDELGPVILAYSASIRPRLHFSDCWGCPGENGRILFRDPDSAVIVQP